MHLKPITLQNVCKNVKSASLIKRNVISIAVKLLLFLTVAYPQLLSSLETAKYIIKTISVYLLLSMATFLMLAGIVRYIPMQDNIGFLQFKQAYLHILPWKIAFYCHVFSIIFALLAGFTQFSDVVLKERKKIHRLVGKIYAYDIFFNFPVAFIMAVYANGQLPGKTAFVILDCLWFWFTLKAVIEVKKGNIAAHKKFMIRSYALTLSAVTLRLWKTVISGFVYIDPVHLYMIDAWLGFIPNLLFAEWLIKKKRDSLSFNPEIAGNKAEYSSEDN